MTEWEKLQTGQLYNDFDRGLFKRRIAAKRLFRAYNRTDDDEQTERRALMEQLFGSVGKNVWIEPDFRCEFGKTSQLRTTSTSTSAASFSTAPL